MITSHFHLHPQFIYGSFHILYIISLLLRENGNPQLTLLPMCGFIAQLVEHRTGNAEVTGSNPVEAWIFFRLLISNCINWKFHCDDHFSLSSTSAVHIWIISYTLHQTKNDMLTNPRISPRSLKSPLPTSLPQVTDLEGNTFRETILHVS